MGSAPFGPTRDLHMRRAPASAMIAHARCARASARPMKRSLPEAVIRPKMTARSVHQQRARYDPMLLDSANRRTPPATAGKVPQHATAGVNTGIASTLGAG